LSPKKAALPAPVIPHAAKVDGRRSGAGGEGIVASTVERVALGYCAEFATICGMNIALFGLGSSAVSGRSTTRSTEYRPQPGTVD